MEINFDNNLDNNIDIEDRVVSSEVSNQEESVEFTQEKKLRPLDFTEYIGQNKVVQNIDVMVKSSLLRNQPMDHALLSGPPGLGKTSLAMIISSELKSQLHVISGPAIEKKGDLAAILTNLNPRDVLFIDEIHRINIVLEEILYSAMEDYRLDIVIGDGPSARTMQIDIAPFTLIGATTRSGLLSNPLRDRFMAHLHFDFYNSKQLTQIVSNSAIKMGVTIEDDAKEIIAKCSRGTPRISNRILRRVRDYSLVNGNSIIKKMDVQESLKLMEIDCMGLDKMDRKIINVIESYYSGGPVGIDALCATLGEDRTTIEDVYEPFLLKEGFLLRTSRGRVTSQVAKEYLSALQK